MALNLTNQHDESCPRCQSRRVVIGTFVDTQGFANTVFRCFRPAGFWSNVVYKMALGRKILICINSESFLCLDCGIVWTTIDPKLAESVIRLTANDGLKRSLGLVEKSKTLEDELA